MEVLGAVASGVTLAALFKYSFEAFDIIQLYQSQDVDFKRLQLQYKLEKGRLYNWGVEMGLADDSKPNLLNEWHSKELVAETLRQIIALFSDAQVIRKKYGCDDAISSAAPSLPGPETLHGITRAFDHFRIQSSNSDESMSRLKKTKWVIRDRKKFLILVSDIQSLVDSLEKITNDLSTIARLEECLRRRVNEIKNGDILLGIASVWKESHPRVASAASTKADSISMSSGKYEFISQWQNSVDSEASRDSLIADVEDLSITELKHSVVSSHEKLETLEKSLNSTSDSMTSLQRKMKILRDRKEAQKS
ncbi:prion-inhibition and propagation-domain-containing protein [Fusarium flagelliforme]|uniref:prion-inhibition and propagation-domain-containing protein n=1 Tax=Fusarium flagelliforme TaxID=2675880 RepID=UPI001E8CC275|nr:prion-inhibition and propagation-domain-containing protein [Fusarium flagelliforme]KAH7196410.1 prion-inhibition and propagation-domain-containing protein [Fusarium flagelliforme]